MNVCCLNCGIYFGELDDDTANFCSKKCERSFLEYLKKNKRGAYCI